MPEQTETQNAQDIRTLSVDVNKLAQHVTEYTTVVRRHLINQESHDRHVMKLLDQHDQRIRTLEEWRAVKDATLPQKIIDGSQIEMKFEEVEREIRGINKTLAKWAGIAVAAATLVQIAAQPLIKWVFGI